MSGVHATGKSSGEYIVRGQRGGSKVVRDGYGKVRSVERIYGSRYYILSVFYIRNDITYITKYD